VYRVYLIKNSADQRYIGLSDDVVRRLEQHNRGESKWTAKYRPWGLVWLSEGRSLAEARQLELKLKAQKGGAGLQTLLNAHGRFVSSAAHNPAAAGSLVRILPLHPI
jgi:putative endonuclease